MLIRICLIVAILAGLAVGILNFVQVGAKITTLKTERDSEKSQKEQAQSDLAKTRTTLDKTTKDLKQTQQELASAKSERDKAVAEAAAQTKKASEVSEKLAAATKDLNDRSADLAAYTGTGYTPKQILNFDKQLKQTQLELEASIGEKKILDHELTKTKVELAKFVQPHYHVPLPPGLRGKVLVTDPKWDFVVLDVGEDQGVLKDAEFLVHRKGRLIAKITVSSVMKDGSIANILPGPWKGEVIEGDLVIPAYPGS